MAPFEIQLGRPLDRVLPINISNPQMSAPIAYRNHRDERMHAVLFYGKTSGQEMKGVALVFWEDRQDEVAEFVVDLPTTRGVMNAGFIIRRSTIDPQQEVLWIIGTTDVPNDPRKPVEDHRFFYVETNYRVNG
jgi:hypothetical protein